MKQVNDIPSPPARPASAHKGTFGTVIIIGGCDTMLGAPALCARAALRSGVGLVKIACPPSILPHVLTIEPSATGIALSDAPKDVISQLDQADPSQTAVLAVGPGLAQNDVHSELIKALLAEQRTIVLDADGLNHLAKSLVNQTELNITAPLILTPHPGEYRRLSNAVQIDADPTDPDQRVDAAGQLANKLNAVVILKGQHSIISDGQQYAINPTGNPTLATAGSGDVLTGLTASLLAQGMGLFDAAQLAANLHGQAADQWASQHGNRGIRAIELADQLPHAFLTTQDGH
ncbi:MAG: NAD(P)H-hydrate dehydratase [Phycisphaeraceae bacterium]